MDVKIVTKKGKKPQAEVRWSYGTANVLLVVGLDGYYHRQYTPESRWSSTAGRNVHLSMNGPLVLSFNELGDFMNELSKAVNEARKKLQELT